MVTNIPKVTTLEKDNSPAILNPVPNTSETKPVAASSEPLRLSKYQTNIKAKTEAMPKTIDKINVVFIIDKGSM